MLSIFWNPQGFLIVDILPEHQKFNGDYFINNILEKIYERTAHLRENEKRKITLHFYYARPPNARKVIIYMDAHQLKIAPHPPYSPDIAASDFYLFGYVKDQLKGIKFETAQQLFDKVIEILHLIPIETLKRVFLDWQERLKKVIKSNGEYI